MTARIAAFALMLTLGFASLAPAAAVHAASASELTASIEETTKEANKLAKQVSDINTQLDETNKKISENTEKLNEAKQQLATARTNMGNRARVMYMFGSDGFLSAIFSSDDFTDTLSKITSIQTITSADQKQVEEVENLQTTIQQTQDDLSNQQKQLSTEKTEVQSKQKELNSKIAKMQSQLQQYESVSGDSTSSETTLGGNTEDPGDQLDFICAVVASESNKNYLGALAVIQCIMNRVKSSRWPGNNAVAIIKAPGQFEGYLGGYYKKYLGGKYPDYVKQAVVDCMQGGKHLHDYQSFYAGSGSPSWGGNHYY